MLILTRKPHQTLLVGDDIRVTIAGVNGNQVRVGIDAPKHMRIDREELAKRVTESANDDQPRIDITIHGAVGIGKSAVALTILDALRAAGIECEWSDEFGERNCGRGADEIAAIERKPIVRIHETNPATTKDNRRHG